MIGHLVEQRCDGIITSVENQQQRRNFSLPEIKQLVLLCDDLLTENILESKVKLNAATGEVMHDDSLLP